MKKGALLGLLLIMVQIGWAQLYINGGTIQIDPGATVQVKGDLISNATVSGDGKIVMNGTVNQFMSMSGNSLPNLDINNSAHVTLTSAARVDKSLTFSSGKIIAGAFSFNLSPTASLSGMGTNKFVETNGAGQLVKEVNANLTNSEMPVGAGSLYRPVYITTTGTYNNASVGLKALAVLHPNKPAGVNTYLNNYWPITLNGISGAVSAVGKYTDPTDITGTEANLKGFFYNGSSWVSSNGTNDALLNLVGIPVTGTGGDLYGMDFAIVPVKFSFFNAIKQQKDAWLTWGIQSVNANTSYFSIERSVNGTDFASIGRVLVNQNQALSAYQFTDASIFTQPSLTQVYYQIKEVDINGQSVSSEIKKLSTNTQTVKVQVYPNPTSEYANVLFDLMAAGDVSVAIFDFQGKSMQSFHYHGNAGTNMLHLNLRHLSKGNYTIRIIQNNQQETTSVIKM